MSNVGDPIKVVLVDECQFLTASQVEQLAEAASRSEYSVIASGLKSDYRGQSFEGSAALLVWADKLEEQSTVCWYCNRNAVMNLKVDEEENPVFDGEQVDLGGLEKYRPVCSGCYLKKRRQVAELAYKEMDRAVADRLSVRRARFEEDFQGA